MVDFTSKRVLVTGGQGFIGGHLVKKLKSLNAEVFILDKESNVDITNANKVKEFLDSCKPHYIFHLAAVLGKNGEAPELVMKINFEGTKNLLNAYEDYEKFVYISTSEFYFGNTPPFTEDMPLHPTTPYSEAKLASEKYCQSLDKPIVIVRPSIVYGPNQMPGMFIPSLIGQCLRNEEFNMTPGEQTRDFIFVDDLTDLFVTILVNEKANGQAFNAASGVASPLKQVVSLVKDLSGSTSQINFGGLPYRENEIMEYYHDMSKVKNILGWQPKTSLEQGLKLTIDSYR